MSGRTICICGGTFTMCEDGHAIDCPASNQFDRYKAMMGGPAAALASPPSIMSGAVEALRHLELMALNTAQTAAAATKVNECVALLTTALTTPPARSMSEQGWQPIATIPTNGTEVLAAVKVNSVTGSSWWERHVIAIDDETGEVHDSLYGGWDRSDYSYWHVLPDAPGDPA